MPEMNKGEEGQYSQLSLSNNYVLYEKNPYMDKIVAKYIIQ